MNAGVLTDRELTADLRTHHPVVYPCPLSHAERVARNQAPRVSLTHPVALLRRCLSAFFSHPDDCAHHSIALHVLDPTTVLARAARVVDACLLSFEASAAALMHLLAVRADRHWVLAEMHAHVVRGQDTWWAGVPLPPALRDIDVRAFRSLTWLPGHFLWFVSAWRCHIARRLETGALIVAEDQHRAFLDAHGREGWFPYQLTLFRDTHLRLLTYMVLHDNYTDSFLRRSVLASHYPSVGAVCCAEELPDLVPLLPLSNLFYDMGIKKTDENIVHFVVHIFLCKVMNHVCQIRGLHDIIPKKSATHPILRELFRLVVYCFLLGNSRGCRGRLRLAARIKFTISFHVRAFFPDDVHDAWLGQTRHFLMFLLREWHFYTTDVARVEQLLSRNILRRQFIELVRSANRDCRRELSRQAAAQIGKPFDWDPIEYTYSVKSERTGKVTTKSMGMVARYHTASLDANNKVRKSLTFSGLIAKKMVATEKEMLGAPNTAQKLADLEREDTPAYLRALHMIGYYLATRGSTMIQPSFLKVLGMSCQGINTVLDWIIEYHEYDKPDDGFKKLAKEFWDQRPRDYLILKRMLRIVAHYQAYNLFFLPTRWAVRQIHALRRTKGLEDWTETPIGTGLLYYCEGCQYVSNPIAEPPNWTALTETSRRIQANAREAARAENSRWARGAQRTNSGHRRPLAWRRDRKMPNYSTYLMRAHYNHSDGRLYCPRARLPKTGRGVAGENLLNWDALEAHRADPAHVPMPASAYQLSGMAAALAQPSDAVFSEDDDAIDARARQQESDDAADIAMERIMANYARARTTRARSRLTERSLEHLWRLDTTSANTTATATTTTTGNGGGGDAAPVDGRARRGKAKGKARVYPPHIATLMRQYKIPLTSELHCRRPMTAVGVTGVWFRLKDRLHGLCCFCGQLCRVHNAHMTNYGLSCMRHAAASFSFDHPVWAPAQKLQAQQRNMDIEARLFKRTGASAPIHLETQQAIRSIPYEYRQYPRTDVEITNGGDPVLVERLLFGAKDVHCGYCYVGRSCRFISYFDVVYHIRFLPLCSGCYSNMRVAIYAGTVPLLRDMLPAMAGTPHPKSEIMQTGCTITRPRTGHLLWEENNDSTR